MYLKNFIFALILNFMGGFISSTSQIEMQIWSDKPDYLAHEPIVVNYKVKNTGDKVTRLNLTEIGFCLNVKDQDGKNYPPRLSLSYGFAFPDSLKPNEEYEGGINISGAYGVVSEGEYTCFLQNPEDQQRNSLNPSHAKSNTIIIKVKEPTGDEKKALDILLEADKLKYARDAEGKKDLTKKEPAFQKYLELVDKYPKSVYAALALVSVQGIYKFSNNLEETKKIIPVCKRLIEEYPNSIFFMSAFTSLVGVYEILKDKTGAIEAMNELIEKHPNTKISEEAERRLKQIK